MESPSLVPGQSQVIPATELLARLRTEMVEIASAADGLQGLVGGLAVHLDGEERNLFMIRVQDLDLLVQRLQGMAAFLHALEPSVPAEWTLDPAEALSGLLLSEQARALGGGGANPSKKHTPEDAGDFFVF